MSGGRQWKRRRVLEDNPRPDLRADRTAFAAVVQRGAAFRDLNRGVRMKKRRNERGGKQERIGAA